MHVVLISVALFLNVYFEGKPEFSILQKIKVKILSLRVLLADQLHAVLENVPANGF